MESPSFDDYIFFQNFTDNGFGMRSTYVSKNGNYTIRKSDSSTALEMMHVCSRTNTSSDLREFYYKALEVALKPFHFPLSSSLLTNK